MVVEDSEKYKFSEFINEKSQKKLLTTYIIMMVRREKALVDILFQAHYIRRLLSI